MMSRFFKAMHKVRFGSDFEHYFSNVGQKNAPYAPTIDEAKRDYRSAVRPKF